jgi:hypothetical protein
MSKQVNQMPLHVQPAAPAERKITAAEMGQFISLCNHIERATPAAFRSACCLAANAGSRRRGMTTRHTVDEADTSSARPRAIPPMHLPHSPQAKWTATPCHLLTTYPPSEKHSIIPDSAPRQTQVSPMATSPVPNPRLVSYDDNPHTARRCDRIAGRRGRSIWNNANLAFVAGESPYASAKPLLPDHAAADAAIPVGFGAEFWPPLSQIVVSTRRAR